MALEIKPRGTEFLTKEDRDKIKGVRSAVETSKETEEKFMEEGEVTVTEIIKKKEGDHNNPFRVEINKKGKSIEAVFKPCGENHGTNCRCSREKSAYLVDIIMGFKIVPTTVVRDVSAEKFGIEDIGSLQAYNYSEVADDAHLDDDEENIKTLRIFDYIIWNYDRHDWNYLVKSDGETIAIDNESSFGCKDNDWARQEIMTDIENVAGKEVPQKLVEILERYQRDPRIRIRLENSLKDLIDRQKIHATLSRIEKISNLITQRGEIPSDEKSLETLTFS